MGRLSEHVFGVDRVPLALIAAGTANPERMRTVLKRFPSRGRVRDDFVKYCIVRHNGKRALLIFGVYGGAPMLEVIHLLKDAGCRKTFFFGSAYSTKPRPIGTFILPKKVIDRAGLVLLDEKRHTGCLPDPGLLWKTETVLKRDGDSYVGGTTVCVPCVLHKIPHVRAYARKKHIDGLEMELSTFYHFSRKEGMKACGLVFVSDSPEVDILDAEAHARFRRRKLQALGRATEIAKEVLFA